jgi:hypothetical protein
MAIAFATTTPRFWSKNYHTKAAKREALLKKIKSLPIIHAGMKKKPLEAYSPNSVRSRLL